MGSKTKIEWCDSTWNPVTGCLHGCEYCYARGIANRFKERKGYETNEENVNFIFHFDGTPPFYELNKPCCYNKIEGLESMETGIKAHYPYGFKPTLHRYRLNDYIGKDGRNVFVCSMADLFGEWVPDGWIWEVFEACGKAPQHNYLFLTKNPARYTKDTTYQVLLKFASVKAWFGTTVTTQPDFDLRAWNLPLYRHCFLSMEPMLEEIRIDAEKITASPIKWVIIGAETGRRKGKVIPKRGWIEDVVDGCRKAGIPVFMKSSLADIWGGRLVQEFPEGLNRRKGR